MLVEEWMTSEVITITSDSSMMKASRIMKTNKIRRLPVVDANSVLVGILTDHDVKSAQPSKATTLEVHEVYYLLSELKVKDVMTANPMRAKKTDSVEYVALLMARHAFGGMPVVDEENKVCGIITESDIFKLLVQITGIMSGGIQLAFELPGSRGQLRPILDELRACEAQVVSILTSQESLDADKRRVYVRLRKLDEEREKLVVDTIKAGGYPLLYWEAGIPVE